MWVLSLGIHRIPLLILLEAVVVKWTLSTLSQILLNSLAFKHYFLYFIILVNITHVGEVLLLLLGIQATCVDFVQFYLIIDHRHIVCILAKQLGWLSWFVFEAVGEELGSWGVLSVAQVGLCLSLLDEFGLYFILLWSLLLLFVVTQSGFELLTSAVEVDCVLFFVVEGWHNLTRIVVDLSLDISPIRVVTLTTSWRNSAHHVSIRLVVWLHLPLMIVFSCLGSVEGWIIMLNHRPLYLSLHFRLRWNLLYIDNIWLQLDPTIWHTSLI